MKLKILNKVSYGYELGYVLDSSKPREGDNIVSCGIVKSAISLQEGDTVTVKVSEIEPTLVDSKWGLIIKNIELIDKYDGKANTTRELLKQAMTDNILKMPSDCTVLEDLKLVKNNQKLPIAQVSAEGTITSNSVVFKREIPLIKDESKQLVYGVVYEPSNDGKSLDAHGDFATEQEIEKTAHQYLEKFGNVSFMHERIINDQAKVVESFIAPVDYSINNELIKKGSWVMVTHVIDKQLWKSIQDKELNAYSIEGTGQEGPNIMKSEQGKISKRNLINMIITGVALVDKGANKKKFYLTKSQGNNMDKELAILLLKAISDKELRAQVIKNLSDEDKVEVEKAFPPVDEKKPEVPAEKKPEEKEPVAKIDPAMLKEIVDAVLAELKPKTPTETPVEDKDVKKYLEDPTLEIPEGLVSEVIKQLTIK